MAPSRLIREPLVFDWSAWAPHAGLRCLPAIAVVLGVGLAVGYPAAGMIAAGGAVSVGFGSFQRIGTSESAPMLLATLGMCVSTLVGTLAGRSTLALATFAAVWGLLYGVLTELDAGASWAGLQSTIALLVAGAYPGTLEHAAGRAALILVGGLLQTTCVVALRSSGWSPGALQAPPAAEAPGARLRSAIRTLKTHLSPHTNAFRYGLRLAVTLAIAIGFFWWFPLSNGYWVPMTALLVLKPDFHQTFVRGVARIAGTLGGAALATLIAALLRPSPAVLALLIVVFAWLCYSLLRVNYALYSVCITIYIVFLLALTGLPEIVTVEHRALNTTIGGVLALIVHAVWPVHAARPGAQ
jgi:hypothetical protein